MTSIGEDWYPACQGGADKASRARESPKVKVRYLCRVLVVTPQPIYLVGKLPVRSSSSLQFFSGLLPHGNWFVHMR